MPASGPTSGRARPERPPSLGSIQATYERIAYSYAAARRTPFPEVVAFLDRLPRPSRVLDLGCGHGRHAKPALARGHAVVGVDLSRGLLARARTDAPTGVWIHGTGTALPLRDASVDAAVSVSMLHHLPFEEQRLGVLREIRRVLRAGGRIFVVVWDRDQPKFRDVPSPDLEVPWPLPDGTRVPRFYHLFAEGELEDLVIRAGLHGETFFRAGNNWFGRARNDG